MRISDWSSDVCLPILLNFNENSLLALPISVIDCDVKLQTTWRQCGFGRIGDLWRLPSDGFLKRFGAQALAELDSEDRKSVVQGKSVSVRVDIGGSGIIKKIND